MGDETVFRQVRSETANEHDLAQIREILFGEQRRQTEQQIAHIETRLREQDETLRRLLDERIQQALDTARRDLDARATKQQTALDALDNALRALLQQTDDRLSVLDSDLQHSNHRLERSVAEQRGALERLQQDSAQRTQLAELLEDLARQLRTPPAV
jgi:chromosome segregation ATPase